MAAAATEVKMEEAVEHVEIGVVDDVEVEDNTIPVDKDEFKVDVNHLKLESEEVPECTIDETLQPSTSTAGVVTIKEEQLDELDCESDDSDSMDIREFKEEPPEEDFDEEMMLEDGAVDTSLTEDVDIKFEATEETLQDAKGSPSNVKINIIQMVQLFQCQQCNYQSITESEFNSHMSTHFTKTSTKAHRCPVCPYSSKRRYVLKKHILIKHQKIKESEKFKCEHCDYLGKTREYLQKHSKLHKKVDEVQMYKCRECSFESKYRGCLRYHEVKHKNIDEIVMFKCEICPYEGRRREDLKRHLLKYHDI